LYAQQINAGERKQPRRLILAFGFRQPDHITKITQPALSAMKAYLFSVSRIFTPATIFAVLVDGKIALDFEWISQVHPNL
jgi:hypothetical protein